MAKIVFFFQQIAKKKQTEKKNLKKVKILKLSAIIFV